ncbi:unnamed protein product [Fraxinus pennsylvanica]|uniref:Uncharacterized protein n=1 Tax=Fraxinus pennsylvanica TaxID=56036 RepID=A0AAD1YSI6_9LAMI|nr:unnamed protein product [Fraxinus pennsylvanica]
MIMKEVLGIPYGATKEDIERLPKYKFRRIGDFDKESGNKNGRSSERLGNVCGAPCTSSLEKIGVGYDTSSFVGCFKEGILEFSTREIPPSKDEDMDGDMSPSLDGMPPSHPRMEAFLHVSIQGWR